MVTGMDRKKARFFISGLLVVGWMIFIFCMSAKEGGDSAGFSGEVTQFLQRLFFPSWSDLSAAEFAAKMDGFHFLIRKIAHFLEFVVLGALAVCFFGQFRLSRLASAGLAFAFGVLYAFTDELHQFFVEGRSMEAFDVCVDAAGVVFGIALFFAVLFVLAERKKLRGSV